MFKARRNFCARAFDSGADLLRGFARCLTVFSLGTAGKITGLVAVGPAQAQADLGHRALERSAPEPGRGNVCQSLPDGDPGPVAKSRFTASRVRRILLRRLWDSRQRARNFLSLALVAGSAGVSPARRRRPREEIDQ